MKLKDLKGTFKARAIVHGNHVSENREAIIEDIRTQIEKQGGKIRVEANTVYIENSTQFVKLPTMPRQREGAITFRSNDYVFEWDGQRSHGERPRANQLTPTGFVITMFNGDKIEYVLQPV